MEESDTGVRRPETDESEQGAVALPCGNVSREEENAQEGALAMNDLMHGFDGYSEFSYISESIELKIVLTEEERKGQAIQRWINSGNIDASSIAGDDERQSLSNRGFSEGDLSDMEESDDENDLLNEATPSLSLRNYQLELAGNAIRGQNTIICAPTGSGKTRVAVHIILNHLQEQQRPDERKRKVVFFARTVPLVRQQFRVLEKFLPKEFKVINVTGDSNYSMQLELIIPEYDVMVMTPRILENHLIRNPEESLDMFTLWVFDECQHARRQEPYMTLMFHYLKRKLLRQTVSVNPEETKLKVKLPQIVGLTASIGVGNASIEPKAVDYMMDIFATLDARHINTVEKYIDELHQCVPVCSEELVKLHELREDDAVKKILAKMNEFEGKIEQLIKRLKISDLEGLNSIKRYSKRGNEYAIWAVKVRKAALSLPRTESRKRNGWKRLLIILAGYLITFNVALELHDLLELRQVMEYLKKCFQQYSGNQNCTQDEYSYFESFSELEEQLKDQLDTENPNLTLLKKTLRKHIIKKGDKSRGIIFVRTRALAHALASWLNRCGDFNIMQLNASVLTGSSVPVTHGGMTAVQQADVIKKFEMGEIRILVATSVVEEGIDVPDCNLVIKYNHVNNEITYIQAKGRCRKQGGICIIMAKSEIIQKEEQNRNKAELMESSLKQLRRMNSREFKEKIIQHQKNVVREMNRQEALKESKKKLCYRQHFKMICHKCSELVIDSDDIRTISNAHRVVINWDIMNQTTTEPVEVKCFDDIRRIGGVYCKGTLEGGMKCNSRIGYLLIFSNIPYVVLRLEEFGFEAYNSPRLLTFKSWKEVPFIVDEIGPPDYQRYLPGLNNSTIIEDYDDESSDDSSKTLEETDFAAASSSNTVPKTVPEVQIAQSKIQKLSDSKLLTTQTEKSYVDLLSNVIAFTDNLSNIGGGPDILSDLPENKADSKLDKSANTLSMIACYPFLDEKAQNVMCELHNADILNEHCHNILINVPTLENFFSSIGQPLMEETISMQMSLLSDTSKESLSVTLHDCSDSKLSEAKTDQSHVDLQSNNNVDNLINEDGCPDVQLDKTENNADTSISQSTNDVPDVQSDKTVNNTDTSISQLTNDVPDVQSDKTENNADTSISQSTKDVPDVQSDKTEINADTSISQSTKDVPDVQSDKTENNADTSISQSTNDVSDNDNKFNPVLETSKILKEKNNFKRTFHDIKCNTYQHEWESNESMQMNLSKSKKPLLDNENTDK